MDLFSVVMISVIGLVLLSIPVMFIISARREGQRGHALQTFAATNGFTYTRRGSLPKELRPEPLFKSGVQGIGLSSRIKNVIRGHTRGPGILLFDYWYTDVGTVSGIRSTKRCTVVCVRRGTAAPWHLKYETGLDYADEDSVPQLLNDALASERAL